MKFTAQIGIFVLVSISFALLSVQTGGADPIARTPPWVIKDNNGDIFGIFISDTSGDIIIGVKDPNDGNIFPLQFRLSGSLPSPHIYLEGNEARVYYSGLNCTGTPYVASPQDDGVRARTKLLGKAYAVGPNPANSNNSTVFKATGAGSTPAILSTFVNGVCTAGTTLFNDVVAATALIDITTDFPPPYTME